MIDWRIVAPMLIVYLLGAATPVFFAGVIFKRIGDEDGGCMFNIILSTIVLLILLILYAWISASMI
jgi:cytochrome c biogenesis protein CcdA